MVQLGGTVAVLQAHPAGPVSETAVVFAGTGSLKLTVVAAAGPLLVTVCAYVILLPAVTGFGLAELVTLKSACVPPATAMPRVTVLSAGFESLDAEPAEAVSLISVPAVAVPLTVYWAVIVAVDPGSTLGFVHETGAALGQVHAPPPLVATPAETNVVLAGVASVKVPALQLLGPWLNMVCV